MSSTPPFSSLGARALEQASVASDVRGAQSIKQLASKQGDAEAMAAVAKQFEGMLLQMMLKSMREANAVFSKDGLFSSFEGDMYQEMLDQQWAQELAGGSGLGLAEAFQRQLMRGVDGQAAPVTQASLPRDWQDRLPFNPYRHAQPLAAEPSASDTTDLVPSTWPSAVVDEAESGRSLPSALPPASAAESAEPLMLEPLTDEESANAASSFPRGEPQAFVRAIWPALQQGAQQLGVDPQVLAAQSALETGWGRGVRTLEDGRPAYNLFNIKAGADWQGERVAISTLEYRDGTPVREMAYFRAYPDADTAVQDYVKFLQDRAHYSKALANSSNSERYLHELQKGGYATDPNYADKVIRVMNSENLQQALPPVQLADKR